MHWAVLICQQRRFVGFRVKPKWTSFGAWFKADEFPLVADPRDSLRTVRKYHRRGVWSSTSWRPIIKALRFLPEYNRFPKLRSLGCDIVSICRKTIVWDIAPQMPDSRFVPNPGNVNRHDPTAVSMNLQETVSELLRYKAEGCVCMTLASVPTCRLGADTQLTDS